MTSLNILEEDITETFILGSGNGGQKLQKTSSCVQLRYIKADIVIKCSESRSRERNRYRARVRLCDKIEVIQLGKKSQKQQEVAKIRRQKSKRSKRAKNKILDDKNKRSLLKVLRKPPKSDA